MKINNDTISAISTPNGSGAISIIRISGSNSFSIIDKIFFFYKKKKKIKYKNYNNIHLGYISNKKNFLDQVMISIFRKPSSYTGEDMIEISCHGSIYIQQKIIQLLIKKGARQAYPGEFTFRSFINGKIDLSQAEAVSDLIASKSYLCNKLSLFQLQGNISNKIKKIKKKLINFASLIELELDFSEENIKLLNRKKFCIFLKKLKIDIKKLIKSFELGNAIKKGIRVVIIGQPNVGKSTLLNSILEKKRAIVSNISGTTRDSIESEINLKGINFRFIDTAGIRKTKNYIEKKSIKNTYFEINEAHIIFYVFDSLFFNEKKIHHDIKNLKLQFPNKKIFIIANKCDLHTFSKKKHLNFFLNISAKNGLGLKKLKKLLYNFFYKKLFQNKYEIINNIRHFECFQKCLKSIINIQKGLNKKIPFDILYIDVRNSLNLFSEITGEIINDKILKNIFSKFCIGK
jgi:tRNA modification GTPase